MGVVLCVLTITLRIIYHSPREFPSFPFNMPRYICKYSEEFQLMVFLPSWNQTRHLRVGSIPELEPASKSVELIRLSLRLSWIQVPGKANVTAALNYKSCVSHPYPADNKVKHELELRGRLFIFKAQEVPCEKSKSWSQLCRTWQISREISAVLTS